MFHFISACNYHVISNSCDTFHANKDGIQLGLENVLGNHCTIMGNLVNWNLPNGSTIQVSFLDSG